jgi:hypothetical protein
LSSQKISARPGIRLISSDDFSHGPKAHPALIHLRMAQYAHANGQPSGDGHALLVRRL